MISYGISFKGTTQKMTTREKDILNERRKYLRDEMYKVFSEKEMKALAYSGKYIIIDDIGEKIAYSIFDCSKEG
jgi:vacuolar-type H+-ATPase subunit H